MIDPVRDGAPDYLDFVKEPMALAEVKRKLLQDEYHTVEDYKRDVNLIWSNAAAYNGEGTLFTDMAREAEYWFEKKMKKFPSSQAEEWTRKIQKTTEKFYKVLAHPPPELDPSGHLAIHMPSDDDNINLEELLKNDKHSEAESSSSDEEEKKETDNEKEKEKANEIPPPPAIPQQPVSVPEQQPTVIESNKESTPQQ